MLYNITTERDTRPPEETEMAKKIWTKKQWNSFFTDGIIMLARVEDDDETAVDFFRQSDYVDYVEGTESFRKNAPEVKLTWYVCIDEYIMHDAL